MSAQILKLAGVVQAIVARSLAFSAPKIHVSAMSSAWLRNCEDESSKHQAET